MDREIIPLTDKEHEEICSGDLEGYILLEDTYQRTSRHTEHHKVVVRKEHTTKYYSVCYATSVKDEMGWTDCNEGVAKQLYQVFPREVITTVYD